MTPARFAELATRVTGKPIQFKTAIARQLNVAPGTVFNWLAGRRKINPAAARYLETLASGLERHNRRIKP